MRIALSGDGGWSDLWRLDGMVDRAPYAIAGVVGFAIKHNLDRLVAWWFGRPWGIFNYWVPPATLLSFRTLPAGDKRFLAALLVLALPFIAAGVVLTLRRLRAIGLPGWLVMLFFVPFVNLVTFALLAVLPSRPETGRYEGSSVGGQPSYLVRLIPRSRFGSAAIAVVIPVALGLAATLLSTTVLVMYSTGLFVGMPFCVGLVAALLYGYHEPRTLRESIVAALVANLLLAVALLAFAVEGVICLAMAVPIGGVLAILGGVLGHASQSVRWSRRAIPAAVIVVAAILPLLMGAERLALPEPPVFVVRTSVDVDAPPERVWREVIAFTEIPAPGEWYFRAGIAYPVRATINGAGPGSVRRCVFSTGAFVEPIEVWDPPRRLAFSVASSPPPMAEWTPYADIHPPHLSGFLESETGEFLLRPLAGGRTRIVGVTRYRHTMWPAPYWRLWSDAIIHRIHFRVLDHIKRVAEGKPSVR
jgi:hypothetical protein